MERTISGMIGKGSINHNTRAFTAKNVDRKRSEKNIEFCHENIKVVYHELFDEALKRYNAKQKRSDRKIDSYYEKIRRGKQEKLFHEVIFQIGNKDDMNSRSKEGQLAKKILTEFMEDFQRRNPNLYVFSAHLHMDEETPHIHIDFVPFIRNSKRGLDTRVSLKGALAAQGFCGGARGTTEWSQWIEAQKRELAMVMGRYDVKWLQKGTHNKHLSILDFEKQEREKEVAKLNYQIEQSEKALQKANQIVNSRLTRVEELADIGKKFQEQNKKLRSGNVELEKQQQQLQKELKDMAASTVKLERSVRSYDEDNQWRLPEPGVMQSAKSYREKLALPLVAKLKELVKNLTIKCVGLVEQVKRLTETVNKQTADIEWYKDRIKQQSDTMGQLQDKVADLERVKYHIGAEKVQSIIDSVKEVERLKNEQKRLQKRRSKNMCR